MNLDQRPTTFCGNSPYTVWTFVLSSLLVLLIFSFLGLACSTKEKQKIPEATPDEVSLKADRSKLDSLREEIPEEKKVENDELALMLDSVAGETKPPYRMRQKYDRAVRNKRKKFSRTIRKQRDEFTRQGRRLQKEFSKNQKEDREKFYRKKPTRDEQREFKSEQDSKRSEFRAEQREIRQEFEASMRSRQKDFDQMLREKAQDFNVLFREYSKNYYDRQTAVKLKDKMDKKARQNLSKAPKADQIPQIPAQTLEPAHK